MGGGISGAMYLTGVGGPNFSAIKFQSLNPEVVAATRVGLLFMPSLAGKTSVLTSGTRLAERGILGARRARLGDTAPVFRLFDDAAVLTGDASIAGLGGGIAYSQGVGDVSSMLRLGLTKAERMRFNSARGNAFEAATIEGMFGHLGVGKNTRAVTEIVNGKEITTIVDVFDSRHIGMVEIKDVLNLSKSKQFMAQLKYAIDNDLPYNLVVSSRNKTISKPLLDLIKPVVKNNGGGIYRYDPVKDVMTKWTPRK